MNDRDDMFQEGYIIHYSTAGKILRTWKIGDSAAKFILTHQAPTKDEENVEDRKKHLQRKEAELHEQYRQKERELEEHYKDLRQKKESELKAHYDKKLRLALADMEKARASLIPRRPVSQLFNGVVA